MATPLCFPPPANLITLLFERPASLSLSLYWPLPFPVSCSLFVTTATELSQRREWRWIFSGRLNWGPIEYFTFKNKRDTLSFWEGDEWRYSVPSEDGGYGQTQRSRGEEEAAEEGKHQLYCRDLLGLDVVSGFLRSSFSSYWNSVLCFSKVEFKVFVSQRGCCVEINSRHAIFFVSPVWILLYRTGRTVLRLMLVWSAGARVFVSRYILRWDCFLCVCVDSFVFMRSVVYVKVRMEGVMGVSVCLLVRFFCYLNPESIMENGFWCSHLSLFIYIYIKQ